jgi:hypothetical protein
MSSWLLANLVHHELTKTLDPEFHYRGAQFPISGSYQVTGPGVNPFTLEAYPENSLVVTFTPGGGYRNVNKNIISHFLRHSNGPIRMIQFAFSSPEVGETLRNRAIESFQNTQEFDFKSVGDTPFALAEWSQFLKMSGLTLLSNDKKKVYFEDPQNSWVTSLTSDQLHQIRGQVKVAPSSYGIRIYKFGKQPLTVTAKIHHKVMATGPYAIVGTSFNFSKGAEENNEQLLVFRDKKVVQFVHGMTEWLFERSRGSTYSEAMKRNKVKFEDQKAVDASDERIDKSAGKQAPDTADSPPGG